MDCFRPVTTNGIESFDFRIGDASFPVFLALDKLDELLDIMLGHPAMQGVDAILIGYHADTKHQVYVPVAASLDRKRVGHVACAIEPGEQHKTLDTLQSIYDHFFLRMNGTRKSVVLALGGGIVSNLFGFAASTIFRGIRLVQMPTTFLNAHDAGGSSQKHGFNYVGRKNVIGTYYMPCMILHDTQFYRTLPLRQLKSGFGEIVKNALIFGGEHSEFIHHSLGCYSFKEIRDMEMLLKDGLCLGLNAKQKLLAKDPYEKNEAIIYEFGHTLGHAYEMVFDCVTHGECVAMGCHAAAFISRSMGLLSSRDYNAITRIVDLLSPEMLYPDGKTIESLNYLVMAKVLGDNKRGYIAGCEDQIPMILLECIGRVHKPNSQYLRLVPRALVEEASIDTIRRYAVAPSASCECGGEHMSSS